MLARHNLDKRRWSPIGLRGWPTTGRSFSPRVELNHQCTLSPSAGASACNRSIASSIRFASTLALKERLVVSESRGR